MTDAELQLMTGLLRDGFEGVRADIRGVHERLDTLNGRTRTLEQQVAINTEKLKGYTGWSLGTASAGGGIGVAAAAFLKVLYDSLVGK